jgi:hypothetical protein
MKKISLLLLLCCLGFASFATDYFSILAGGDASSLSSWTTSSTGVGGSAPLAGAFTSAGNTWTITNGSAMTNSSPAFTLAGLLTINSGSYTANPTGTLTLAALTVTGTGQYITPPSGTMNVVISGALNISGFGVFTGPSATVLIGGDLNLSGSGHMDAVGTSAITMLGTGAGVPGNVSITGSAYITNSFGVTGLNFNNFSASFASPQTLTWTSSTTSSATYLSIQPGSFLRLNSDVTLPTYNGSSAQVTGTLLPSTLNFAGNGLTINNAAGVTLSQNTTISTGTTLAFTSGKLSIGARTLTINGSTSGMSATNSLTGSASSNLSIGGTGALGTIFFDQTTPGITNNISAFTLNRTGGSVTLGNALVSGTSMTLTNGQVVLNGQTLQLNGSFSGSTSANLVGSAGSVLTVNGAAGTLFFDQTTAGTTNFVSALNMNAGSSATLGNNLSIGSGALNLTAGSTLADGGNVISLAGTGTHTSSATGRITMTAGGTISGATIGNLTLNNAGGFTLSGSPTINGTLTMTSGNLTLGANNLTLGSASVMSGLFSNTNMIVANGGGQVRKQFSTTGTFLYPIGDNTANYTPITLAFTGGAYSAGAYAGVSVTRAKQPNNANTNNYLNRYWTVTTSGITSPVYGVTALYADADVVGSEANISMGQYPGALPWIKYGAAVAASNTLTAAGVTSLSSDFTGITTAGPTVNSTANSSICIGNSVTISATSPTGDPAFSYSWGPAAGLSTVAGVTTVASPTVTTVYTVTITDGNGFTSTHTTMVTVNPLPTAFIVTGGGRYCSGGAGNQVLLNNSTAGVTYSLFRNGSFVSSITASASGFPVNFGFQTANGIYTVTAIDGNGCSNNMLGTATISIDLPPAPFSVTGGGASCSGGAGFPVGLSGSESGINYQLWNGAAAIGSAMSGTSASFNFTGSPFTSAGTYTVSASNPVTGCTSNMSGSAVITVNPLPTIYTVSGTGNSCAGGSGVALTLSGSQAGTSYQLYNSSGIATGGAVLGTGIGTLSLGSITTAGTYTVVATSIAGCSSNMTGSATVTINPLPIVYNVTSSGGYCTGGTGIPVHLDGFDFGAQTVAGVYTILAVNPTTGCSVNMTGSHTITVNPPPNVHTLSGGGSYCFGGTGVSTINLDFADNINNYQLYRGATLVYSVTGTGAMLVFPAQTTAGTYSVVATNLTTGCSIAMLGTATVSILPLPGTQTITGGASYCAGGTGVHIGLASSTTGIDYQLYNSGGAVSASYPGASSGLDFGVYTAGTYSVIATNAVTACSTSIGNVTVVSNPLPTNTFDVTGGGTYCAGAAGVPIGLSWSDLGINYQLYNGTTAIGPSIAGTGTSAINFGLQIMSGTYTVMATNATTGCSAPILGTSSGSALVTVMAAPAIYTVTGTGSLCAGGAGIPLSLSWSDVGTTYQLYNGSTPVSAMGGIGGALNFGSMTAPGTYTIVASDGGTCTSTMAGTAVVTVNPLPVISAITGTANVCPGATITLATTTGGGLWTSSDNTIATVSASGVVTGVAAIGGVASITYSVTNGFGCSAFVTKAITVDPLPTIYTVFGGGSICTGSTAGFHIMLTNSDGGVDYQLYNGTTLVSTMSGIGMSLDFGLLTTGGTYTVNAINTSTGCSTNMASSATITVSPLPTVHTVTGGGSYCAGSSGVHIGLSGSDPSSSYTLYMGASAMSASVIGTGFGFDFGPFTTAGTYTVVATNGAGCMSDMAGSAVVSITALPSPGSISGPTNVCAGLTLSLAESVAGGVWSSANPAFATVGSSSGVVTGVSAGMVNISYTITSTSGCSNATGYLVNIGLPMPSLTILPLGSATLCHGNPVNLSVVTSDPGLTFQWADATGDILGAISSTYVATSIGSYSVTVNNNGTCSHTYPPINVINQPHPVVSYDSSTRLLSTGTYATYQWLQDSVIVTGANASIYSPGPAGGIYRVLVSDGNGCFDTSDAVLVPMFINVSNHTTVNDKDITIYPNPASSVLHIDAPVKVFVSIVSPDGRVVIERKEAISINVGQLADGMYMIMVYDENNMLLKADRFTKLQ